MFHWGRAALSGCALAAGLALLVTGLATVVNHPGEGLAAVLPGLGLSVAAGYSFRVTRWWSVASAPPLRPAELALAHVAPTLALLSVGLLLFAVWLGIKIAMSANTD